ncbi:MAG: UDP-glucose 4-epimerase [Oscillospiraceae bacterium]|jgi:dTDP-glucose 4,6-dehydratase|nr:UDP-glucose 4-epimerase [Oscillospiraceae bacterium]
MGLTGKKIMVTGADGFIGSHLTEELVRQGHSVRAFVYYNAFNTWGWLDNAPPEIKKTLEVIPGDIRDSYGVKRAMQGVDVVFHLAALIAIPYSYYYPESYFDTNVKGTLNVLQAARELGTEKIIHTSTSEVYGTAQHVPITETHPLHAQSPYAASKTGADQMALAYYCAFGTPVAIIRPFNTYGPRQSNRAVIPTIITQIAQGVRKIKLGSLTPTRDFNYVTDTVSGFIAVAETPATIGEVINIGSNFEVSIKDTAYMISSIMGAEIDIESEAQRIRPENSEVERLWADTSKAQSLFGWAPAYGGKSGFRRGLSETITWFSDKNNLKHYKAGRYNL